MFHFDATVVGYLGHVISGDGVAMDGDKVEVVAMWLQLRSARALRVSAGFFDSQSTTGNS